MEILEFIRQYPVKSFSKGEILLCEGQSSDVLYAVQSGFIKATSLSDMGVECFLWVAGYNDIVPPEHLFSRHASLGFFCTALTDVVVYKVDKKEFLDYVGTHPSLMAEVARMLSARSEDLLRRVDSAGQVSIHDKLIRTLCYLGRRFSDLDVVDIYGIGLHLTHHDIAAMIGSTRETTSLELRKLLVQGGISYDRRHFIIDIPRLTDLRSA